MSYTIRNSRGDVIATLFSGQENTTATSLTLYGPNFPQYGLGQNENFVYLTENFANTTAPDNPTIGQLWYNSSNNTLYQYTTNLVWQALATQDYVQAQKISPVFTGVPQAPTAANNVSTGQLATTLFVQNAIDSRGLAPIANPIFTGVPQAPTAANTTANTQIASTAFVSNLFFDTDLSPYATKVSPTLSGVPTAPTAAANTANAQIATTAFVTTAVAAIDLTPFATKASPIFTGVPQAPTAANTTANTQIATTAFVADRINSIDLSPYAPKASPTFTGIPIAPAPAPNDSSNQIATTAYVQAQKISPAFTGVPTSPTAPAGTNTTQIATTEFVSSAIGAINFSAASEVAGSIKMWVSSVPPTGWALCNGQALSRTVYATLFSRIGTTYGAGNGTTTFNVPNFSNRFPIGSSNENPAGSTGGFADAAVVSHTHPVTASTTVNDPGHVHQNPDYSNILGYSGTAPWITQTLPGKDGNIDGSYSAGNQDRSSFNATVKPATTGVSVNTSVSISAPANSVDGAGRNLPPFISGWWIIKLSDDGSGGGTLQAGAGIDILTGSGFSRITNVGVTRLIAGAGITLTSETGNITISSTGGGSGTADIAGTIKIWGGGTEPTDWMFCDGRAISRTEYVSLFSRIGTAFGEGDGSTTFNIPDFKDRTAVGTSATKPRGSTGIVGSALLDQIPVGSVVAWTVIGPIPTGWLLCNGTTSSRTTEAALFAVIGTTYNTGGESSTVFRLPDYRAMFLRGLDEGRGIDPLRTLGPRIQKGSAFWKDSGTSPGSAAGDFGVYALTSGIPAGGGAGLGSTGKNSGLDSFGAVAGFYQPSYVASEFPGFPSANTPVLYMGYDTSGTAANTTAYVTVGDSTFHQQMPDGYYKGDVFAGVARPINQSVRYIIKARPSTVDSTIGYQSAPYIIKVNDNGTQRSGTGGGDTSRAGDIKWVAYAPNNFPPGWQLCDGSELVRSAYPALFARIGTTYGAGNGTTTFNVPDLRGRFIASETAGATGANRANITRGGVGGSADAVVVTHRHELKDPVSGAKFFGINDYLNDNVAPAGWQRSPPTGSPAINAPQQARPNEPYVHDGPDNTGDASYYGYTDNAGESGTGKNLPPYVGMVAMIKLDDDTVNTGGILQAGPGISITTSGIYSTISATGGGGVPVVAGSGIKVTQTAGGQVVSADVVGIRSDPNSSITVVNNNGVVTIGGGGSSSGSGGFGYGTWINKKNQRSLNTTYTNTTGAPLQLFVTLVSDVAYTLFNISMNGSPAIPFGRAAFLNGTYGYGSCFVVIPPNNTYRFTGGVVQEWWELENPAGGGGGGSGGGGGGIAAYGTITRTGGTIPVNPPGSGAPGTFTASLPALVQGQNVTVGPIQVAGQLSGGSGLGGSLQLTYTFTQQITFSSALPNANYTVDADAAYNSTSPVYVSNYFPINDLGIKIINQTVNGFEIQYSFYFTASAGTAASSLVWTTAEHPQVRFQVVNSIGGGGGSPAFTGATWKNVTSSRTPGTTYTNNTGQPLQVSIYTLVTGPVAAQTDWFFVDGLAVASIAGTGGTQQFPAYVYAIVPPGSTYRLNTITNINVPLWRELSGGTGGGGGGGGSGLGYNQTWQNVTASRAKNITYTNTTGSPIQVNVSFLVNNGYIASLLVDNVVVGRIDTGGYEVVIPGVISAVVPPGSTYRASTDFGAIDNWAELR